MSPVKIILLTTWLAGVGLSADAVARYADHRPRLGPTPPLQVATRPIEPPASPPSLEAHAEPEKAARGLCDYSPRAAPCWCWVHVGDSGVVYLSGDNYADCDSAEDYVRSVARFGPPRNGFVPGFRPYY